MACSRKLPKQLLSQKKIFKNMKKIILFFIALTFTTFATPTLAATATSSASQSDLQQKAQKLLDLVASDAAKLNLTEKRGVMGIVTDTSSTQITIDDAQGNRRFIDVDELTKFSNPAVKGTFGISDIEKGQKIGVLGLYNKSSRRILARFINIVTFPKFIHGTIISVDGKNYNFDVLTDENKQFNIDVETVTKSFSYSSTEGLRKAGFSKVNNNLNVVVIGYTDKKDATKIIADIIILLPETLPNPAINTSATSGKLIPSPTTTSSTGSGKTLTPITH